MDLKLEKRVCARQIDFAGVNVPAKVHERLKKRARHLGWPMSELVGVILTNALDQLDKDEPLDT